MNEKQRSSIKILNDLRYKSLIDENEYFLLLEFVVSEQKLTYIPYYYQRYDDTCGSTKIHV